MWRGGAGGGSWIADVWVDVCGEEERAGQQELIIIEGTPYNYATICDI